MVAPKNLSAGQIINQLRRAEVALANGKRVKQVCRELGVSEQTYYRWRKEYGGMKVSQAKRLKALEKQNQRLKQIARPSLVCSSEASEPTAAPFPRRGPYWMDPLHRTAYCSARS